MNQPALIPRRKLFGNPDRIMPSVSPDGRWIAFLAPEEGVMNIWVAAREDVSHPRSVTHERSRGLQFYLWAYDGRHLLFVQDSEGDENFRLYSVDVESVKIQDLTPMVGVRVMLYHAGREFPDEVMVGINDRDPQWHDLYRVNVTTGERKLLVRNDRFAQFVVDEQMEVRAAIAMTPDGSLEIYRPAATGGWEQWDSIPHEDTLTTGMIGFDVTGRILYMIDSRGRNTSAAIAWDVVSGEKRLLAEDLRVDTAQVLLHPATYAPQAVAFIHERKRWQILDRTIEEDFAFLAGLEDGELDVVSRSLDDRFWVVAFHLDRGPTRFYLYERTVRRAQFLFVDRSDLEGEGLAPMYSRVIASRDSLELVVYYSLPPETDSDGRGLPEAPLPTVFLPHGGPWGRDYWGFDSRHQWLANRGYAVVSVNFRSSTGFGKAFINAGDRQWGEGIMNDQEDAVRWAIAEGISDARRVGVLGGSFGGYSVLAGLTRTPELFACGADVCGPSNLITLLESVPPYWKPTFELFAKRVGDPRTDEGRALLERHSPLSQAGRIKRPLLIAQGANDPRVKRAEADQIVDALRAKKIPVTYLLYPDEGHGFVRPENNVSFYAVAEAFFARHLGGRREPVGTDVEGSSMKVLEGSEEVPGLGS